MSVNKEQIKQLRLANGWTQLQLAEACGLSLRTIQRVEKQGSASVETRAALAAVFKVEQSQISVIPKADPQLERPVDLKFYQLTLIGVCLLGAIFGAGLMYWVLA